MLSLTCAEADHGMAKITARTISLDTENVFFIMSEQEFNAFIICAQHEERVSVDGDEHL